MKINKLFGLTLFLSVLFLVSCASTSNSKGAVDTVNVSYLTQTPNILVSVEANWKKGFLGGGYESFTIKLDNQSDRSAFIDWTESKICTGKEQNTWHLFAVNGETQDFPLYVDYDTEITLDVPQKGQTLSKTFRAKPIETSNSSYKDGLNDSLKGCAKNTEIARDGETVVTVSSAGQFRKVVEYYHMKNGKNGPYYERYDTPMEKVYTDTTSSPVSMILSIKLSDKSEEYVKVEITR